MAAWESVYIVTLELGGSMINAISIAKSSTLVDEGQNFVAIVPWYDGKPFDSCMYQADPNMVSPLLVVVLCRESSV